MKLLLLNPPVGVAQELSQRKHKLLVACHGYHQQLEQSHTDQCTSVQYQGKQKVSLQASRQIRGLIKGFEPDLIHAFLPNSLSQALFATWGIRTKPKIVSFRGITRKPSKLDPSDWISYLSPGVSFHACESNAVMQAMIDGGIARHKCAVVYNCTSTLQMSSNTHELRQQYGIPQHAFVIGTVACIRPVKGIDILLQAAIQCSTQPNLHFLLVGECKDPRVLQLASDPRLKDRVTMTGHIANAPMVMPTMDLFVMPSRREGLCRSMLEAMNLAICPIVSDAGGMKEMVRHGLEGEVFASENVSELVSAIGRLCSNDKQRQAYGLAAQQRVREMCSASSFCTRLEAIYQSLVTEH